jgi:GH15 family glucan-1,4-alpha-glucosidase
VASSVPPAIPGSTARPLWFGVPLGIAPVDSDLYRTTVRCVRDELYVPGGGVRRYQGDTFYGGSQWLLLAASLGWAGIAMGETDLAADFLRGSRAPRTRRATCPHRSPRGVQSLHMLAYWRERGGWTATPLLWSHAVHVILRDELTSGS